MTEMGEVITGGGLVVSGVCVKWLIDAVLQWRTARNQKTEIANQPVSVKVESPTPLQTEDECIRLMSLNDLSHAKLFKEFEEIIRAVARLEERMKDIHEIKNDIKELLRRN
jgi:hypothetical protein